MIVASIDSGKVMTNFKSLRKAIDQGVDKALLDIGLELMRLSQIEVPHDEGTLQNSGTVEVIDGDVVVGYHTHYAARLHEHPEYRFQKGRKGKYLENPIIRNSRALGIKFTRKLSSETGIK